MQNKAFTLIELLVVVLIIGILSAIALPQYQKAVARAHGAEAITLMRSVIPAIEEYMLANNAFPPSWDVLSVSGGENLSKYLKDNDTLTVGNYRYILIGGRIDCGLANSTKAPRFIWQSPYATAYTNLPQRTILCYWNSDNSFEEFICKTYGSTVLEDRFIAVQ